jgi:hypothetical protein
MIKLHKKFKRRSLGTSLANKYKAAVGHCWWLYNYCVLSELENANSRNTKSLTNCTLRRITE